MLWNIFGSEERVEAALHQGRGYDLSPKIVNCQKELVFKPGENGGLDRTLLKSHTLTPKSHTSPALGHNEGFLSRL